MGSRASNQPGGKEAEEGSGTGSATNAAVPLAAGATASAFSSSCKHKLHVSKMKIGALLTGSEPEVHSRVGGVQAAISCVSAQNVGALRPAVYHDYITIVTVCVPRVLWLQVAGIHTCVSRVLSILGTRAVVLMSVLLYKVSRGQASRGIHTEPKRI